MVVYLYSQTYSYIQKSQTAAYQEMLFPANLRICKGNELYLEIFLNFVSENKATEKKKPLKKPLKYLSMVNII